MTTPTLTPITGSSQIIGADYNPVEHALYVQFTGGATYEYAGVPNDVAAAFFDAESKGKAFGALIRGKYATTKLPAAEAADNNQQA